MTWQDEGERRPRGANHNPCAWYVGAHELQPAAIEGRVRWLECESHAPGESLAVEKAPAKVVCAGKASETRRTLRKAKDEWTAALTDRRWREVRQKRRQEIRGETGPQRTRQGTGSSGASTPKATACGAIPDGARPRATSRTMQGAVCKAGQEAGSATVREASRRRSVYADRRARGRRNGSAGET